MQPISTLSSAYVPNHAATDYSPTTSVALQPVPPRSMATEDKNGGCMSGCTGPVIANVVGSLARVAIPLINLLSKRDRCDH